jgi:hypothetical protein
MLFYRAVLRIAKSAPNQQMQFWGAICPHFKKHLCNEPGEITVTLGNDNFESFGGVANKAVLD